MRYPEFLKQGGAIGFPAPSFGCATFPYKERLEHALEKLGDMGFSLKPGENAFASSGVGISNTPENCARELTELYCDPETDALISCGGGELMCEILEHMDFKQIRDAKPKLFMGYSDNTNFIYPLLTLCDVASVYGPCAGELGMEPWHESIHQCFDLFCGKTDRVHSYAFYQPDEDKPEEALGTTRDLLPTVHGVFRDGELIRDARVWNGLLEMKGRMIGGCLDCLINLAGTPYEDTAGFLERYKEDGFIWFLEACDLNVFSIRRAMWELEQAGWFKYVKGFVFGRPLNGQEIMGLDAFEAFLPVVHKIGAPAIFNADFGHIDPPMPLLMGSIATVTEKGNALDILMERK
jgi:muramoyltetrapeptide carboxypeptidase LdcA involved in peptidoglycan recycling